MTACVRLHAFTFASTGERLIQQEGNLVVYNAGGTAIWHNGTGGHPGAFLTLQDDGNLVVYDASGKALWWLGAYAPPTAAPAPTVPTDCSAVKSPVGIEQTVLVEGIRVHRCIANAVGRMIRDARAAGIKLTGGGWRSMEGQLQVRRNTCLRLPFTPPCGSCAGGASSADSNPSMRSAWSGARIKGGKSFCHPARGPPPLWLGVPHPILQGCFSWG